MVTFCSSHEISHHHLLLMATRNPAKLSNQLRLVVEIPMIYKVGVKTIPGGFRVFSPEFRSARSKEPISFAQFTQTFDGFVFDIWGYPYTLPNQKKVQSSKLLKSRKKRNNVSSGSEKNTWDTLSSIIMIQ